VEQGSVEARQADNVGQAVQDAVRAQDRDPHVGANHDARQQRHEQQRNQRGLETGRSSGYERRERIRERDRRCGDE
jgi:hypothetical protein